MRPSPTAVLAACALAIAAPGFALAEGDPLTDAGIRAVRQAFPIQGLSLFDTRARGAGCADVGATGLVWCATGTSYETAEGGTFTKSFGYNLDAAGRVVYVILTRREFPLAREKFDETVKALGARYGRPATTLNYQGKTAEGDEFSSLVAYWGAIKLTRLNAAEMRIAAAGGTLGRGPLVDHRQDVRASARQGEPVYKIEGTAGFIAEFRSLGDVRTDYIVRSVYQPAFLGEAAPKREAAAPKPAPKFRDLPLDPGWAAPLAIIRAEEERVAAIERARREAEERKAAEERARREEIERKAAEERRIAEEKKAAEERAIRAEAERKAAAERRIAEEKAAAERKAAEAKAAVERKAAEEKARREAAERAAAEERARREEAERRAAEAKRIAEERARREEAERKAAEAKRIAEERARLEEAERKAAAERRAIEERFRRAEAEYRASLERAQRAEAERRAAEERARLAEEERRVAEEKARRIEAERKAAEERRLEDRRVADRRVAEERARREDAERKALEERRSAEERRIAEERRASEERRPSAEPKATEERKPAQDRGTAEERPPAPRAEAPRERAPSRPIAEEQKPPQFAGPVPGVGGPAAASPEANREEFLRHAIAQSRNSPVAWIFERMRDRISDDVLLRTRAIFPGAGRSALEIAFECNIGAGKRLSAHVRAFDERSNAAIPLPLEDGRISVVRGSVTLDEEVPQTAFLFPERGERQASIVELPLAHDDIRKNTPRAQAWLRHYRVVLKVKAGDGEATAAIYPYSDNLRRVLEACAP